MICKLKGKGYANELECQAWLEVLGCLLRSGVLADDVGPG